MASNVQRGTRRMDASDWVRIKKLRGATNYVTDQPGDVNNPPPLRCCAIADYNRMRRAEFGTSKIRRPASNWTDYRASQTADFVLESREPFKGKTLTAVRVCNCAGTIIV
jgi:hypothetical protein